jgi:hypothetical protein
MIDAHHARRYDSGVRGKIGSMRQIGFGSSPFRLRNALRGATAWRRGDIL